MEEIKKVVNIDTTKSVKSIKQLREQVAGLTGELEDLEIGSSEYAKKVNELAEAQGKLDIATESMQGKTVNALKAFDGISQIAGGLAGGISAVSATFVLFGKDSENLQKTMVKLQAAIAIVQGIGGLKGLGEGILNGSKAFKALAVSMTTATGATGGLSVAMGVLRSAIISTGIGALVVGLGLLISKIISFRSEVKLTDEELQQIVNKNQKLREQAKESFWENEYKNLIKYNPELEKEIENTIKATNAYKELNNVRKATGIKAWELKEQRDNLENIIGLFEAAKTYFPIFNEKEFVAMGKVFGKTKEELVSILNNTSTLDDFLKEITGYTLKEAQLELSKVNAELEDNTKFLEENKDQQYDYKTLVETGNKILAERAAAEKKAGEEAKKALEDRKKANEALKATISELDKENKRILLSDEDIFILDLNEKYQQQLDSFKKALDEKLITQDEYNDLLINSNKAYNKEILKNNEESYKTDLENRLAALQEMQSRESQLAANKEADLSNKKSGVFETKVKRFGSTDFYQSKENVKNQYEAVLEYNEGLFTITNDRITRENDLLDQQQMVLDEMRNNNLIKEEEYSNQSYAIKLQKDANERALEQAKNEREEADLQAFKDRQAKKQQAIQATMQVASSLTGALANTFKTEANNDKKSQKERERNFKAYKALATTQAIIDTISSAQGAYKAMIGIPFVGPVLAPIAAATAVLAGVANVKAIQNEQLPGSQDSAGAGTTAPEALTTAPVEYTRNLLGNKETDELNQPIKCYVLESDITSAQTKVAVTESNASF